MPPTPTDDTLKALLRGDLPADELARLESLLSESPDLQARLEQLSGATEFKSHFHADLDATTKLPRNQPRASSTKHPASSTPSHLGSYEIIDHIATGGMGIVYKARDPDLKRTVAIKLLAPALAASDEAKNRFLREAAAAAAIEHPNIVPIYAIDKDSADQPFLVMRFIEGGTLQDYLDQLPPTSTIPDDFIITIATAVARALAAAHSKQLVHRDIKPSNILLESPSPQGERTSRSVAPPAAKGRQTQTNNQQLTTNNYPSVYLTDFGLARAVEETAVLTRSGTFLGTPRFTSPEQAEGLPVVDHRADLFSLGAVLYTLATGETPFSGDSPTTTIYQVVHKAHQPVHQANPKRPAWLGKVIDRLLKKSPDDRYQSAQDLLHCLENKTATPPTPNTTRRSSREKKPVLAITTTLVAIAIAGALAITKWGGSDSGNPASTAPTDVFSLASDESTHPDLPTAIAAASANDIIKIPASDSPILLPPLTIPPNKALTLAAADPDRPPTLSQTDPSVPFLTAQSPLTLSHLTFSRSPKAIDNTDLNVPFLIAEGDSFQVNRCRFDITAPPSNRRERSVDSVNASILLRGPIDATFTHSQLYVVGQRGIRLNLEKSASPSSLTLENNLFASSGSLGILNGTLETPETLVTLKNNTFIGSNLISFFQYQETFPIRFITSNNVFDADSAVITSNQPISTVRDLVSWSESNNFIATTSFLFRAYQQRSKRLVGPVTLEEWRQIWNLPNDTGTIHRRENPLAAKYLPLRDTPSKVSPESLSLSPEQLAPLPPTTGPQW